MIDVENLTFAYSGKQEPAVKDMSFSVGRGEIFGFLGPSGAGKSTTQKILIKLLTGYQGRIRIMGNDLTDWRADYYERVGVSFELPNHYQKLTALENLNFFRSLYSKGTEDPMELLEMVGLENDADTRVSQFSKGMQMRLTFLRALLHRPELIFLDEPTAGLDPTNARKMKDIVLDLKNEGRTVFLTTHDMTFADQLCDRVAFLVDGKIAAIDSPRELKVRQGQRKVRVEYRENSAGGAGQDDGQADVPSGLPVGRREFALDGLGQDEEFLDLLRSERVETIHTEEATLEDIFIDTTGKALL